MGRPPSNGGPAFRFTPNEVAEMEAILHEHGIQIPSRDLIVALSEKFSQSAERVGKMTVQVKQVWNWFQNRRFALRSKLPRPLSKSNSTAMPPEMAPIRNAPLGSQPQPVQFGRSSSENPQMEFEAKSARDGAWYDVQAFLSHRYLDTGDLEVRVRCAGFGADEDEWVNVTCMFGNDPFLVNQQNALQLCLEISYYVFRKVKSKPFILMPMSLMLKDEDMMQEVVVVGSLFDMIMI